MIGRPLRILLAGSCPAYRNNFNRHLIDAGYDVRLAATASDVILLCDLEPPDVVILDLDLPDMDGFEICEYVRHETREFDVTIILLAEVADEMTRSYLDQMVDFAGGDYFLAKPCDGHVLQKLLDTISSDGAKAKRHSLVASNCR